MFAPTFKCFQVRVIDPDWNGLVKVEMTDPETGEVEVHVIGALGEMCCSRVSGLGHLLILFFSSPAIFSTYLSLFAS